MGNRKTKNRISVKNAGDAVTRKATTGSDIQKEKEERELQAQKEEREFQLQMQDRQLQAQREEKELGIRELTLQHDSEFK